MTMKQNIIRFILTVWVAGLGLGSGDAEAQAAFDGYWSVEVVAEEGPCRARTIRIEVTEGEVSFAGLGAIAEGAVTASGRLRAAIMRGANVITARGALRGGLGTGSWSSDRCSGHWLARRG
jgi:hypothetical protein